MKLKHLSDPYQEARVVEMDYHSPKKWWDFPIRLLLKAYGYNGYVLTENFTDAIYIRRNN